VQVTAIEVHSLQHLEVHVIHYINTSISIVSGCQFAAVRCLKLSKCCCLSFGNWEKIQR